VPVLRTLIEQVPGDLAVVVDVEEQEPPILRFRTGAVGTAPPFGSTVRAAYEVGSGTRGNIPANGLRQLERNVAAPGAPPRWDVVAGVLVRNPQAGRGGVDPTPLDEVRRDAPEAFAVEPRRAVLPADYAAAAARIPLVERAMARRSWSGSWPLVTAVVDLTPGAASAEAAAETSIRATLDDLRMLGTEVAVVAGTPIGLLISLDVCVRPGADPEAARREILRALRPGSSDRPGFFNPTRLRLGTAVYLSGVLAAAAAVPAVDAVEAREARRLSEPQGTVHQVLDFAPDEVPVLDDDPARPERGRLDLRLRGGS
jgi:predicted phage baseplate assembly protein